MAKIKADKIMEFKESINKCIKYNKKTGVLHAFMAYKFKEKIPDIYINRSLDVEVAKRILYLHGIPTAISDEFLKEMEKFKLIKRRSRNKILVLR